MLSKVEFRNRRGDSLVIPFEDDENGLGIAEIEGLDPTKATIVTSGIAGEDGVQHHTARRDPRTIKFNIDLIPDFLDISVRSLRQELYRFLMPKSEVTMRFHDSLGSYNDILGVVEDFKAPLFTRDPAADISVFCGDPDFFDPNPVLVEGFSVSETDVTTKTIPYIGSASTGILFQMDVDRPIGAFTIDHVTPNGTPYQLGFAETLLAGDKLVISTISGSKGAALTRDGVTTSILWGVSPMSKWLELEGPGDNEIRVSAASAGIPWNIQYVTRLGGL